MSSDTQQSAKRAREEVSPINTRDSDKRRCVDDDGVDDGDDLFHDSSSLDYHLDESTILENPALSSTSIGSGLEEQLLKDSNPAVSTMEGSIKDSLREALRDPEIHQMLASVFQQSLKEEISSLRQTIREKDDIINDLTNRLDALEQYTRRNSVRITGIPETSGQEKEDTDTVVMKVGEALGLEIKPEMIDRSHRIGKPGMQPCRPIIVKFASYRYKSVLMRARRGLKNKSASSLGFSGSGHTAASTPSSAAAAAATPVPRAADRVFVNDDLTRARAQLAAQARKLKREGGIQDTWVFDGDIFVKKGDAVTKVTTNSQLEAARTK